MLYCVRRQFDVSAFFPRRKEVTRMDDFFDWVEFICSIINLILALLGYFKDK